MLAKRKPPPGVAAALDAARIRKPPWLETAIPLPATRSRKPPGLGEADALVCDACGATSRSLRLIEEPRPRVLVTREDISAAGFDDFRQAEVAGGSGDPLVAPTGSGIRIPLQPLVNVAYRVLLAVVDLDDGDAIVGIRQGAEIGAIAGGGVEGAPLAPMYPVVRPVVTYNWAFVDSRWVWTLTRQPLPTASIRRGPLDQDSFSFEDSTSSALVYATATIPAPAGAALPGYLGLTAYTPPALRGTPKMVLRDIRYPWDGANSEENVYFRVERPERWRLYCDVMQTNPVTRNAPTLGTNTNTLATSMPPEEMFLQFCQGLSTSFAVLPVVWRVHGRVIVERSRRIGK